MRWMGLDLGTRTIGIALSDPSLMLASIYTTLHFEEEKLETIIPKLKQIIEENDVQKIIVGLPKNMNNTIGDRAKATIEFAEQLKEVTHLEVVMQDERLTTVEATHYLLQADMSRKKRKKKVDGLAANIILQTYLDKNRRKL